MKEDIEFGKTVKLFVDYYQFLTDTDIIWIFNEYKKMFKEELIKELESINSSKKDSKKINLRYKRISLQIVKIKSESPLNVEFVVKVAYSIYRAIEAVVTVYGFSEIIKKVNEKIKERKEEFKRRKNIKEIKFSFENN